MDSVIVAVERYLPFLIPVVAGIIWLIFPHQNKFGLAVRPIVALVFAVALTQLAAAVHNDPRPLVVDHSIRPLFAHPTDNGFPSDHTTLAATVAFLATIYRRWLGAVLLAASVLVGAARVAAHVHHGQDIIAGVLIAVVAVGVTTAAWAWVRPRLSERLAAMAST